MLKQILYELLSVDINYFISIVIAILIFRMMKFIGAILRMDLFSIHLQRFASNIVDITHNTWLLIE